jgi:hypothetical protein
MSASDHRHPSEQKYSYCSPQVQRTKLECGKEEDHNDSEFEFILSIAKRSEFG